MTNNESKLLKVAVALVKAANKYADQLLPGKLAGVVKTHALLGVGSAFIPIPGADLAAGVAAIWGMYIRINSELGISLKDNLIKSIASGIATNLAGYAGTMAVLSTLKLFPVIGTIPAIAIMSAATYAMILASGYIYMQVLTSLFERKSAESITAADLDQAVTDVMRDKSEIKAFVADAKKSYKKQ